MSDGEKKEILELLEVYSSLPALWDTNCVEYSNRAIKDQQYEILLRTFRKQQPRADKQDLKKKINSLRTNYRREFKRKIDSESRGAPFVSSLYYFDKLSFLYESEVPSSSSINTFEVQVPLKKKKHKPVNSDELLELATKRLKRCDDHSQTLANVWASEFRLASEDQKFYAKKAIDDILFEARLGTLHRNSVKINEDPKTFVTSDCTIETSRRTSSPIQTDCSDYTLNRSKRYSKHASASSLKRESYNASQRHYSESSLVEEIGIEADSD